MFTVKVSDSFSAAHRLKGYKGDCERLHGHNYRVEIAVESPSLTESGIVADFRELKTFLKGILAEMDHQYLNDLPTFSVENPSAENIAKHIYTSLSQMVNPPARLKEVTVWENENCCASYTE
jgi:6-pyruvoyltetrahydropterin/6-carboxytetrahydropterin synthase